MLKIKTKKYDIIDGFKRFHWLNQKNIKSVSCLIFHQDISTQELLLWKLNSHTFHHLSCIEIFQILDLLNKYQVSQNDIVQSLPAFNLPPSLQRFHQIKQLKTKIQNVQELFQNIVFLIY